MTANFTPNMSSIKDMKPFRFWCQKVLPTVYDDSLSYYELLNKVVNYLNDTVDNVELLNGNVTNIYNAYVLLESYVNTYFETTLPQMVEDKLDEMAEDGTLTQLIGGYVDPLFRAYVDEVDSRLSAQDSDIEAQNVIVDTVNERLDNFVVQHSGLSNETILYDGEGSLVYEASTNISLSDALSNYKYLRFIWKHREEICVQDFAIVANASPAQNFNLRDTLGVPGLTPPSTKLWEMCQITVVNATAGGVNQLQISASTVIDNSGTNDGNVTAGMNTGILKVIGIKEIADSEVIDARLGYNGVSYETLGGAIRGQFDKVTDMLLKDNCIDIFNGYCSRNDGTSRTVVYEWSGNECHVSGSPNADAITSNALLNSMTVMPKGIAPGDTVYMYFDSTSDDIYLNVMTYHNGQTTGGVNHLAHRGEPYWFTIPATATGLFIRIQTSRRSSDLPWPWIPSAHRARTEGGGTP